MGGINFDVNERHIRSIFAAFGAIKSTTMTLDPQTGMHKGFAFVDYEVPEASILAIAEMDGAVLGGRPLKVGRQSTYPEDAMKDLPSAPRTRIYVANVQERIGEDQLKEVFEAFGKVKAIAMPPNSLTRRHKGYAFIEFENGNNVNTAVQAMNGFELGGLKLKVMKAVVGVPMPEGMASVPQRNNSLPSNVMEIADAISKAVGAAEAKHGGKSRQQSVVNSPVESAYTGKENGHAEVYETTEYDDTHEPGSSEHIKSLKLAAVATLPPSRVMVMKNMVDVDEVDDDLVPETREECMKHGQVQDVIVKIMDDVVNIFVLFHDASGSQKCVDAMEGRWFAGRQIRANLVPESVFASMKS